METYIRVIESGMTDEIYGKTKTAIGNLTIEAIGVF